jgi:hypothetical protein
MKLSESATRDAVAQGVYSFLRDHPISMQDPMITATKDGVERAVYSFLCEHSGDVIAAIASKFGAHIYADVSEAMNANPQFPSSPQA